MKAITKRWLGLCVSAFLCTLLANADTYNLTFNIEDFEIIQQDGVVSITPLKPSYTFDLDTSLPALPYFTQRITIDGKSQKETFTYEVNKKELIASNVYVSPNKECYATNTPIPVETSTVLPDYGQQIYPETTADFIYGTTLRDGKEISYISVSPFEYDTANGNLYFISSISLSFDKEITIPSRQSTARTSNKVVKYLIVTQDSLADAFKPLRDWKTQKGVRAEIISIETIDSIYEDEGYDIQERIKRCLKDYYDNYSLDWVLLGGDNSVVPSRHCYIRNDTGEVYNETVTSDSYYANFEGAFDWNANKNNYYGEITDNIFLTPQIKVSRLPIRNKAHVEAYTQKLLNYEQAIYAGPWMNRMLLSGSLLQEYKPSGISDAHYITESMYALIESSFGNLEKYNFYDTGNNLGYTGSDSILNTENLINAFNSVEPHYFHMNTHGYPDLWQFPTTYFYSSDVASLENNNKPMIITSESCYAGYLEAYGSPKLCEAFIGKEEAGALAFWGSSFLGFGNISDDFCRDFWINLTNTDYRFADVVIAAKSTFISQVDQYNHYRTLLFSMNALGDPELTVYTNATTFPDKHINMKFYADSVFVQGLQTDIITTSSLGDNGDAFYRTGEYFGGGKVNTPVLVCIDRLEQNNQHYLLTIKSGHNVWGNGYNNLYLQGQTFPGGKILYSSDVITIGRNIDSTQVGGDVVVKHGTLTFDSSKRTVISNGFRCEEGARLIIK